MDEFTMMTIGMQFITMLFMIPLGALLLWGTTKIFKLDESSFKSAILIAAVVMLCNFILGLIKALLIPPTMLVGGMVYGFIAWLLVGFLMAWLLIKHRYHLSAGKSLLVWLVWTIIMFIVALIIGVIVGIVGMIIFGAIIGASGGF